MGANGPNNNLLGVCFLHSSAFPHGPEAADLTVSLCHLLQEQNPAITCHDEHDMSASDFLSIYEAQANFCEENAELIAGAMDDSLPDAQQIRDTAVVEALHVLNSNQIDRRQLFISAFGVMMGVA